MNGRRRRRGTKVGRTSAGAALEPTRQSRTAGGLVLQNRCRLKLQTSPEPMLIAKLAAIDRGDGVLGANACRLLQDKVDEWEKDKRALSSMDTQHGRAR